MPVNADTSKRVGNDRILPDAHRLYASSCNPGRDSKTLHKRWWCHIDSIAEVDNQVLQVHTMYQNTIEKTGKQSHVILHREPLHGQVDVLTIAVPQSVKVGDA